MKERPILFSGAMVRAILEGKKTQTRRVAKPFNEPASEIRVDAVVSNAPGEFIAWSGFLPEGLDEFTKSAYPAGTGIKCPYGQPGDRLWVRETCALNDDGWVYRATDPDWETMEGWKWKPSIFMPRVASRILLEITNVRVERLQDIDEEDAVWEGIEGDKYDELWMDYSKKHDDPERHLLIYPSESYRSLWQSINGPESWAQNPWVWVIEFRRIQPEIVAVSCRSYGQPVTDPLTHQCPEL